MGSGRRSKALQKNVSVYLGQRGDWQDRLLGEICRKFNMTESQFFRELFLQRLANWELYDPAAGEPIAENCERFRLRLPVKLPETLSHNE